MKKYILPELFFALFICVEPLFSDTCSDHLLTVTDPVRQYSNNVILPKLKADPNKELLNQCLLIVKYLMDSKEGISASRLEPFDFIKLSLLSRNKFIEKESLRLLVLPKEKREIVRILHNKYMIPDTSGIFFGPCANDMVEYKSAFGCSHYARTFMAIVKSLGMITNEKNMRYAVSCESESFNQYLAAKKKKNKTINGHQFVIVKIENRWYAINTNRLYDYVELPDQFSPDNSLKESNIPICFKAIPGKTFLLRKIGNDFNDDCRDNTLDHLMNIYRSGEIGSDKLNWGEYRPLSDNR